MYVTPFAAPRKLTEGPFYVQPKTEAMRMQRMADRMGKDDKTNSSLTEKLLSQK